MIRSYYQDKWVTQYCSDALSILSELENGSIDLLATDPPYGIGFMGKDWDRALPDKQIWRECLRVLKPGAFAFVMSIPRADCLSRMIISLEGAGFLVNFTPIFWAYASGFPKAQNIGKAVDKKLGVERDRGNIRTDGRGKWELKMNREQGDTGIGHADGSKQIYQEQLATSPQAKALDGSYGGFQPKPAVEVIIVAMKPLSEKTFVDQALKNRKGITWLDDCRVPYENEYDKSQATPQGKCTGQVYDSMLGRERKEFDRPEQKGRFPANLLVSDDVLNDGKVISYGDSKQPYSYQGNRYEVEGFIKDNSPQAPSNYADSGSFSRYFDLDKWAQKTFPFLIVRKASKSEKNKGIGNAVPRTIHASMPRKNEAENKSSNNHPTVKPLKLMSYLITLGSRERDIVLDPFVGSGTTAVACKLLNRHCIGIDTEEKYCEIAAKRCSQDVMELNI